MSFTQLLVLACYPLFLHRPTGSHVNYVIASDSDVTRWPLLPAKAERQRGCKSRVLQQGGVHTSSKSSAQESPYKLGCLFVRPREKGGLEVHLERIRSGPTLNFRCIRLFQLEFPQIWWMVRFQPWGRAGGVSPNFPWKESEGPEVLKPENFRKFEAAVHLNVWWNLSFSQREGPENIRKFEACPF